MSSWRIQTYTPYLEICTLYRCFNIMLFIIYLSVIPFSNSWFSYSLIWNITKTYQYNFDPLKLHFYKVKLGFTGVYIMILISAQKHRLWHSLEPSQWGSSNEYPQSMLWAEIWKISEFLSKNIQFLVKKFSIYLNRCVFIMNLISWESWFFQVHITLWNEQIIIMSCFCIGQELCIMRMAGHKITFTGFMIM